MQKWHKGEDGNLLSETWSSDCQSLAATQKEHVGFID